MNSKIFLVVSACLIAAVHQSSAQMTERFVMNIGEYSNDDINTSIVKNCRATVISNRHVLTTADCATASPSRKISVVVEASEMYLGEEIMARLAIKTDKVFMHPDYRTGQDNHANVAVVSVSHYLIVLDADFLIKHIHS